MVHKSRNLLTLTCFRAYVLHFLGKAYPSRPGFTAMLLTVFLQLLHCIVSRVALALIEDAAITIPGILTSFDICSDCNVNIYSANVSLNWLSTFFFFPLSMSPGVTIKWALCMYFSFGFRGKHEKYIWIFHGDHRKIVKYLQ